jgi:hypothetical protein
MDFSKVVARVSVSLTERAMMDFLFGGPYLVRFAVSFILVLGLIGLTAELVRRFRIRRPGVGNQRGGQSRLADRTLAQLAEQFEVHPNQMTS